MKSFWRYYQDSDPHFPQGQNLVSFSGSHLVHCRPDNDWGFEPVTWLNLAQYTSWMSGGVCGESSEVLLSRGFLITHTSHHVFALMLNIWGGCLFVSAPLITVDPVSCLWLKMEETWSFSFLKLIMAGWSYTFVSHLFLNLFRRWHHVLLFERRKPNLQCQTGSI